MKSIKKLLRVLSLVLFILLATVGVGLSGGVPIQMSNRKDQAEPKQIEAQAKEENEEEAVHFNLKQ